MRAEQPTLPKPLDTHRRVAPPSVADSCYFRSRAQAGKRKALLKITDRCDLRCAHCFVSATEAGSDMKASAIIGALPRLAEARVSNVTLTGGEPFVHPDLIEIAGSIAGAGMDVTICTNAVQVTLEDIDRLVRFERVRVNVSLDGATADSHGRFRGNRASFDSTLANTRRLGEAGLLKGILCTPNRLANDDEYRDLYFLARDLGVEYLLMNPLSKFGRGVRSVSALAKDVDSMTQIQNQIPIRRDEDPEAVFIRFPNSQKPLAGCIAGEIFYVFVNGDAAVCPYLVFASDAPGALHRREEFIVGNLFRHDDFAHRLDSYDFHGRYSMGKNLVCGSCSLDQACGKGCPAAVIANGGRIGDVDAEVCPVG